MLEHQGPQEDGSRLASLRGVDDAANASGCLALLALLVGPLSFREKLLSVFLTAPFAWLYKTMLGRADKKACVTRRFVRLNVKLAERGNAPKRWCELHCCSACKKLSRSLMMQ